VQWSVTMPGSTNGLFIFIAILVAGVVFVAGRRFQTMVSARRAWRNSVRAVPIKRPKSLSRYNRFKTVMLVAAILAVAFWFYSNTTPVP
jgi:hypothetical protein